MGGGDRLWFGSTFNAAGQPRKPGIAKITTTPTTLLIITPVPRTGLATFDGCGQQKQRRGQHGRAAPNTEAHGGRARRATPSGAMARQRRDNGGTLKLISRNGNQVGPWMGIQFPLGQGDLMLRRALRTRDRELGLGSHLVAKA